MKIRTIAPIIAATAAGVGLTYVPWPSADLLRAGLARFAGDAGRGVRAIGYETAAWTDRARIALDMPAPGARTAAPAADPIGSLTGLFQGPALPWIGGTIAAALLVFGGALLIGWGRRRPAATTKRGARARQVATGTAARLDHARALAAAGRLSADVARESALSRDATDLLLRLTPRPDAISGTAAPTGRTFRRGHLFRGRAGSAAPVVQP